MCVSQQQRNTTEYTVSVCQTYFEMHFIRISFRWIRMQNTNRFDFNISMVSWKILKLAYTFFEDWTKKHTHGNGREGKMNDKLRKNAFIVFEKRVSVKYLWVILFTLQCKKEI